MGEAAAGESQGNFLFWETAALKATISGKLLGWGEPEQSFILVFSVYVGKEGCTATSETQAFNHNIHLTHVLTV